MYLPRVLVLFFLERFSKIMIGNWIQYILFSPRLVEICNEKDVSNYFYMSGTTPREHSHGKKLWWKQGKRQPIETGT